MLGARAPGVAEGDALVGEGVAGDLPAPVDLSDDQVVGDEDVVEEDLVEDLVPVDLLQRADGDPGEDMSTRK
nr:hypothetical protein GCM10020093_040600 [Planobispora longispora]